MSFPWNHPVSPSGSLLFCMNQFGRFVMSLKPSVTMQAGGGGGGGGGVVAEVAEVAEAEVAEAAEAVVHQRSSGT